jgi:hypothetical protein
MGGCATSKYSTDELKNKKKAENSQKNKKDKPSNVGKEKEDKSAKSEIILKENASNVENSKLRETAHKENTPIIQEKKIKNENFDNMESLEKEVITEKENLEKQNVNDDEKKEVTTYQTTVVKHSQKEGEELLQHLRDEAFKSIQNLFIKIDKVENDQVNSPSCASKTTTKVTSNSKENESTSYENESPDDFIKNVKNQVVESLGRPNENSINKIIDEMVLLIKLKKVKTMNELQEEVEKKLCEEKDLITKVINSATGYLTAKGTEAGVILSNILANASPGIQGVMNETEKTTVKVTRTVTEHFMSGGQLKDIAKFMTSNDENYDEKSDSRKKIDEILKNITKRSSNGKLNLSGSFSTAERKEESEIHEKFNESNESLLTKKKAQEVVSTAVNAAVEKVIDESSINNYQISSKINVIDPKTNNVDLDTIKVEESNSITFSTTKIIFNSENDAKNDKIEENGLDKVQKEFYKNGKESAEELIKTIIKSNNDE